MCKMLELNVCFVCGIPSGHGKKVSRRSPALLALEGKEGSVVLEDGSVHLCPYCYALIISQQGAPAGLNWKYTCAVCGIQTYRKRVRALPLKKFQFLVKSRKPGSITIHLEGGEWAVVCLDCSETLWIQSDEYDKWGLPENKRHFNWMARPPPPEDSDEANLARLPSGKSQLPRSPQIEPMFLASSSSSSSSSCGAAAGVLCSSPSSIRIVGRVRRGGGGGGVRRSRSDRSNSTSSSSSSSNQFDGFGKMRGGGGESPSSCSSYSTTPTTTTTTSTELPSLPIEKLGLRNGDQQSLYNQGPPTFIPVIRSERIPGFGRAGHIPFLTMSTPMLESCIPRFFAMDDGIYRYRAIPTRNQHQHEQHRRRSQVSPPSISPSGKSVFGAQDYQQRRGSVPSTYKENNGIAILPKKRSWDWEGAAPGGSPPSGKNGF